MKESTFEYLVIICTFGSCLYICIACYWLYKKGLLTQNYNKYYAKIMLPVIPVIVMPFVLDSDKPLLVKTLFFLFAFLFIMVYAYGIKKIAQLLVAIGKHLFGKK